MRAFPLNVLCLMVLCACQSKAAPPAPSPEELQRLAVEAASVHPPRPKDWQPATNDRVIYRAAPNESWQLYDVLWDPPLVGDTFRELWQPKNVSVNNKAKLKDVYPFPPPEERPRLEVGDLAACIAIDPDLVSSRDTRTARIVKRTGEMLELLDVEGQSRRVHSSDCLRLER